MRRTAALVLAALAGCASHTGVYPIGPGAYAVSEMRSPVRGGGLEALRLVQLEASAFCQAQNLVAAPLTITPNGDPYTPYWPTAYDEVFQCVAPRFTNAAQPGQIRASP